MHVIVACSCGRYSAATLLQHLPHTLTIWIVFLCLPAFVLRLRTDKVGLVAIRKRNFDTKEGDEMMKICRIVSGG